MTKTKRIAMGLLLVSSSLAGCPMAPGMGGGSRAGKEGSVNPDGCGTINTSEAGRKVYAFLVASSELQKRVADMEQQAHDTCVAMGNELAMPAEELGGDTKQICHNVAMGLRAAMSAGVKPGATIQVDAQPAECVVNADATAELAASCEGKAKADVAVTCEGTCQGTCSGACKGKCAARNANGECAGQCDGACHGSCSGSCQGTADVQAEASCQAAADVRASLDAECTPPEVEVKIEPGAVVDQDKVDAARRAIHKGLPKLLALAARLKGVSKAFAVWSRTARELSDASGKLAADLGQASVCVAGQLAAAFQAVASIQVQVEVSVSASAEVGGACGAGS